MYYQHKEFETPNRSITIWHYFSLSKFLSLLSDRKLYFTRSDQFYDNKEGKLSEMDKKLYDSLASGISNQIEKDGTGCYFVNCWVMHPEELYLMWNTYSSLEEGIAIKSTVGHLIDSLDPNDERKIVISDVQYMDYGKEYTFDKVGGIANLLAPQFCKREYFSQEKELRLVYHNFQMRFKDNVNGQKFEVNLDILVDSVWIAPNANRWYYDLIKKEMELHSLFKPLCHSNI